MKMQSKINGYKNLIHTHNEVQKSLIFGVLTMLFCYIINVFEGDDLVGVLLAASIIHFVATLIRSSIVKKRAYQLVKLNHSLDDLVVAALNAGLELQHCEDQKYVFQTKYCGKTQVVIRSSETGCEIIALEGVIACLESWLNNITKTKEVVK